MGMCIPGANEINADGGVLGHKLSCASIDTRGDPADAIPVIGKLLASRSSLAGVIGPTSDEATAVVPLFNQAKVTMFAASGNRRLTRFTFSTSGV